MCLRLRTVPLYCRDRERIFLYNPKRLLPEDSARELTRRPVRLAALHRVLEARHPAGLIHERAR